MSDYMLTVADIATRERVSDATVRSWIKAGLLRARKSSTTGKGGRFRVSQADYKRFITTQEALNDPWIRTRPRRRVA